MKPLPPTYYEVSVQAMRLYVHVGVTREERAAGNWLLLYAQLASPSAEIIDYSLLVNAISRVGKGAFAFLEDMLDAIAQAMAQAELSGELRLAVEKLAPQYGSFRCTTRVSRHYTLPDPGARMA